jgi:hypothetical protein
LRLKLVVIGSFPVIGLVNVNGPGKGAVAHNLIGVTLVGLAAVQDVLVEVTYQEEDAVVYGAPAVFLIEMLFRIEARLKELHELEGLDVDEALGLVLLQVADHQLLVRGQVTLVGQQRVVTRVVFSHETGALGFVFLVLVARAHRGETQTAAAQDAVIVKHQGFEGHLLQIKQLEGHEQMIGQHALPVLVIGL